MTHVDRKFRPVFLAVACFSFGTAFASGADANAFEPVWQEQQVTAEEAEVADYFAMSTALSGATAVMGALNSDIGDNSQQGAAYVFTQIDGVWARTDKLWASDGAEGDHFGYAVATDGERILVGGDGSSPDGDLGRGAAYLYVRSGDAWVETQKFVASDGEAYANFGHSVALDGPLVVISAPFAGVDGNYAEGAVYAYEQVDGSWVETKLTASDGAAFTRFGYSLALSGDTVLVGADGANFSQGAAYVFDRTDGIWSESQKLVASDGASGQTFGTSVALQSDAAVVGSPYALVDEESKGAAYVYARSKVGWSETAKLGGSNSMLGDRFGFSVALEGNTLVAGATLTTVGDNVGQGTAYRFSRNDGEWQETARLLASDGFATDFFGFSVALNEGRILVGADNAAVDDGQEQGEGAAYFYTDDRIFGAGFETSDSNR